MRSPATRPSQITPNVRAHNRNVHAGAQVKMTPFTVASDPSAIADQSQSTLGCGLLPSLAGELTAFWIASLEIGIDYCIVTGEAAAGLLLGEQPPRIAV